MYALLKIIKHIPATYMRINQWGVVLALLH
jgi:hypothetical protein